jgi:hypothetical protein
MGEEVVTEIPASKPWVQFACVCEKVLREPDNVASLIRIVDTYNLDVPPEFPKGFELPPGISGGWALPLTIAVSLKSGDVSGEYEIGLRLTRPSGQQTPIRKWPAVFRGGEAGVTLVMAFVLESPTSGLYWIEVLWFSEVLARIPLRINPKIAAAQDESTENAQIQQASR